MLYKSHLHLIATNTSSKKTSNYSTIKLDRIARAQTRDKGFK